MSRILNLTLDGTVQGDVKVDDKKATIDIRVTQSTWDAEANQRVNTGLFIRAQCFRKFDIQRAQELQPKDRVSVCLNDVEMRAWVKSDGTPQVSVSGVVASMVTPWRGQHHDTGPSPAPPASAGQPVAAAPAGNIIPDDVPF